MDNGIFGLAMYGALKRDEDTNHFVETKKGLVTLEDLVKFYETHIEEKETSKETVKRGRKHGIKESKEQDVEQTSKGQSGISKKCRVAKLQKAEDAGTERT